jgi:hypothetical protein
VGDLADLMPVSPAADAPSPAPVGDSEVAAAAVEALARVLTLQQAAGAGLDDDPDRVEVESRRGAVRDANHPDRIEAVEDAEQHKPEAAEAVKGPARWRRAVSARLPGR